MTMAKKSSKPAKKRNAKPKGRARPTASRARTGKRPARRSTKAARTTRRKPSVARRGGGKRKSRTALRAKKRPAPRAGGRLAPKAKTPSKTRKQAKPVGRKAPPKAAPKVLPKAAPKLAKTTAKIPAKPQAGPAKAGVVPTAPVKPSPGEIAARLSARRTEKALAEGKVRSGKNGGVELRKVELTPAEAEARKTRLKNLIVLGKERSYLTYAEINDHLPDDILDAEQIEGIISMINDMGIQVYDEAPDAETLLMSCLLYTLTLPTT
jgi:RNA polymerase primary sigma factor